MSLDLQLISQPPASRAEQALHDGSLRETIATVLHLGLKYFGLEVATFSEQRGDALVVHGRRSDPEDAEASALGPPGFAARGVVAIHDADKAAPELSRRLRSLGKGSYLGAPLDLGGGSTGLLEFTSQHPRAPFGPSDLEMIASLARWLESELMNAGTEPAAEMRRVSSVSCGRSSGSFFVRDVRSSLTSLIGLSSSLEDETHGPLTEQQKKALRAVHESGRHVLSLVNDILEIARIDSGEVELALESCDTSSPCEAALAQVRELATHKKVQLFSAIDPRIDHIRIDKSWFSQIITTLAMNAVRLADENGHVGIDVMADDKGQCVTYSVWDDGPSLAESDFAKLFSPFSEADATMSQPCAGLGVGLTLVHRIADLHHGSLTAERPRHGNRFTVTIPNDGTEPPSTLRAAWQNLLVLLSDPNGSLRSAAQPWLRSRGHRVLFAKTHQEALDQARMFRPDVVLMDVTSSDPSGIETLRRMRRAPDLALATVPVVATSALCLPGDAAKYRDAGATEYLRRPLPMRNVVALVERHGPFAKAG